MKAPQIRKDVAAGIALGAALLFLLAGCGTNPALSGPGKGETPIATKRTVESFKPEPAKLPEWKRDGTLTIKPIVPIDRDDTPTVVIKPVKKKP